MSYSPVAFIAPNYRDYNTYWLKAYTPGTTTPKTIATSEGGATTVAKLQLNADGFFVSAGGAIVMPYLSGPYDAYLFPTEALADANDTTGSIRVANNISNKLSIASVEFATLSDAKTGTSINGAAVSLSSGDVIQIKNRSEDIGLQETWDVVLTSSVTPDGIYIIESTQNALVSFVQRDQPLTPSRDLTALTSSAFGLSALQNKSKLVKLRDTLYTEFACYTPMTADGIYWHRWLVTNRFNVTNDGAPRVIMCTLAGLYPSVPVARTPANNVTETTATSTTATRTSSQGTNVGSWTGPATVLTTTDVEFSSTAGDTITYTITGVERISMRALLAGNGGIGKVTVSDGGTEIAEANYNLPAGHLVDFISTATGNTTMHFPIAEGLTSGTTYTVEIKVDTTNPAGNRVYQAGLLGYSDIAFDDVGINGIVLDAVLGGQTNSLSVASGTTAVYRSDNATKVDWSHVQNPTGSIIELELYNSSGAVVASQSFDQYAVGSTAAKIDVASGLTKGTYYLHVKNGKTKNAASSSFRYYDFGSIGYDESTAGDISINSFDDFDVPLNVQDPNNDSGLGTKYLLIGTGNIELAISVRKTTDNVGSQEFVGGIHGNETTPSPVFKQADVVFDFDSASTGDSWISTGFDVGFSTVLSFPVDSTSFIDVDYDMQFGQFGYSISTSKTSVSQGYIHNDYSLMLNCPNTDTSQGIRQPQGLSVGGGFKYIASDSNYIINTFDNGGTDIAPLQKDAFFTNYEYSVLVNYNETPVLAKEMEVFPYQGNVPNGLIQDRTDRTVKIYTRAFPCDFTNGVLVEPGLTWGESKTYKVTKGNLKGLVGKF